MSASGLPYQRGADTTTQLGTSWRAPQKDDELMTKEEVLDFKPASRLEQIGDMHSKRCADSPSPRKSG
jgi:hypothetical protein